MASSSPPVVPISTATAGSAPQAAAPVAAPAFRLLLSRLSDAARPSLADCRPWSEMVDRSSFSRPDNLSDAAARLRRNLSYFRVNYAALLAAALAVSFLTHPFSLLVLLGLLAAWYFLYLFRPADPPLAVLGRRVSDREALGGLVALTVFVVFLTTVGSLIVSALMAGAGVVCVHGAFRVPDDLFLDYEEVSRAAAGFPSWVGGAAPTAGAAPGPAVTVRV